METGLHAALTKRIIGCAIEVHAHLGPGLLESVYEAALCIELEREGLSSTRQLMMPIRYKGETIAEFKPDLVVHESVVVEIKSVERLDPIHAAQMLTYLRITGLRVGLLLNFNSTMLHSGIRRIVL